MIERQYDGLASYLLISQVITKESLKDFTDDEIFPIQSISYEDMYKTGAYGTTTIQLKSGAKRRINFEELEAGLSI